MKPNEIPAESKLSDKLAELLSIENDISNILRRTDRLSGQSFTRVRDLIRDALHKAHEIATEFGPTEMSVEAGIGVPPRVSVSFTWPISKPSEGEEVSRNITIV
jgi:hypothetical protein